MFAQFAVFAALLPAALAPAVPAPTDVTLAWASDAHLAIALTWHETGDYADQISLYKLDGTPLLGLGVVAAGQPDQFTFPVPGLPVNEDLRFSVQPVDANGQAIGAAAESVGFDTDQGPQPVLTSVVPRPDGTVLMTWKPGVYKDDTPDDPLDLPAGPVGYLPLVSKPYFVGWNQLTKEPITAESFVATTPLPEWLVVVAARNEFGIDDQYPQGFAPIRRTDLTASIPHTATTGRPLVIHGTSILTTRFCDPGACETEPDPDYGRVLLLQERTGTDAPWHTVATAKATLPNGSYQFRITSPGTRDYRVVADALAFPLGLDGTAASYAATKATTTRSGPAEGGGGLPITGPPVAWIAAAGALLALLGAALVRAGRRRSADD